MNERPDARLAFGEAAVATATELPNVINLDKTTAGGLFVSAQVTEAGAGGTSLALEVKGSPDGTTYATIAASPAVPVAGLTNGKCVTVGIPREDTSRYLKVALAKTGTFTAGKVSAYIDTYTGV